ncbi:T9SS type A sorting domain-containing protein [Taibaiella soli]|uniref:Secretion system C-terminal sorting domain-containing protein n=1 Tax=Taibaiella soli TaxID=1649169 RepID=A0A2W2BEN2_9BACT|nr:T9SS type A sorting domain-containing protein [Taibaiella soli]PZF74357.1 hypothetical protein DN068_01890 [Taibaiella soli]
MKRTVICFLVCGIFLGKPLFAQTPAKMLAAPEGSYTAFFNYFDPSAAGMPANAANASKGVAGIENFKYSSGDISLGSGFIIRTSRSDGKVCLLTAGHVVSMIKDNPQAGDKIPMDLYFQYLGRDNNGYAQTISGISASVPNAMLAAYSNERIFLPEAQQTLPLDYAILLIDKKMLPKKSITTLGYNLNTVASSGGQYYALGHPNAMPMCIANGLNYQGGFSLLAQFSCTGNNNIGHGFSGGALFAASTTQNNDAVIGLLMNGSTADFPIPNAQLKGRDEELSYLTGGVFLHLQYIADKIRQYCQQASAGAQVVTDPYLAPEDVDNMTNWNAFQVNVTASNLSGLATVSSADYTQENPNSKLFRGNVLTMNFNYLASTASQNLVTSCIASETDLENGFAFTADNNTEFSVYSVVPERPTSTSRVAPASFASGAIAQPTSFAVIYPNPSFTGIFSIDIEHNDAPQLQYYLQVYSFEGKVISQKKVLAGMHSELNLQGNANGTYIVIIKDEQGNVQFSKQVNYLGN